MFNVGDKVVCVKINPYAFTLNKVYDVVEFRDYGNNRESNSIASDDGGLLIVNHFNLEGSFELYKPEAKVSKVNYIMLNESVTISHEGSLNVIKRGDPRFKSVITCIRENRLHDIVELLETKNVLAKAGLTEVNGVLHLNGEAMPDSLSQRIQRLMEEEMPIDIMIRFWENLKKNPSFNSRKMLYAFLEHNGHPLTEDGCFIAYRGVREDFKDKHSGKFDNSVGQVCEVARTEVDDNPNNTCSFGLHVACFDYARSFGEKLIEVKVNPADVVAVPTDYNGTKMRVCKFEVLAECEAILTGSVYGRTAGTQTDDLAEDDAGYDFFPDDFTDESEDNEYYDSYDEENE